MLNNGFPLFSIGEINIIILIAFIIAALNMIVIKEYELITGIAIIISTIIIMFTSFTFWYIVPKSIASDYSKLTTEKVIKIKQMPKEAFVTTVSGKKITIKANDIKVVNTDKKSQAIVKYYSNPYKLNSTGQKEFNKISRLKIESPKLIIHRHEYPKIEKFEYND